MTASVEVRPAEMYEAQHERFAAETIADVQAQLTSRFDMDGLVDVYRNQRPGTEVDLGAFERALSFDGHSAAFSPHFYSREYGDEQAGVRPTPLERLHVPGVQGMVFDKREDGHEAVGAFKARGALYAVLDVVARDPAVRIFTTASAGNHAQGLLAAVNLLNTALVESGEVPLNSYGEVIVDDQHKLFEAHVYCRTAISRPKRENLESRGAKLFADYETLEAGMVDAELYALQDDKAAFIHPFDDPRVMAGQGTVALELLSNLQAQGVDIAMQPVRKRVGVGGGGLYTGCQAVFEWAIANGILHPDSCVIAVEPSGADSANRAMTNLPALTAKTLDTKADGLATLHASDAAVAVIGMHSPGGVHVVAPEYMVRAASMLADAHDGYPPELAAVVSLASLLYDTEHADVPYDDAVEVTITSGGNVAPELISEFSAEYNTHPDERVSIAARRLGGSVFRLLSREHSRRTVSGMAEVALRACTTPPSMRALGGSVIHKYPPDVMARDVIYRQKGRSAPSRSGHSLLLSR